MTPTGRAAPRGEPARENGPPAIVFGALAVAVLSFLGLWLVPRTEPPPKAAVAAGSAPQVAVSAAPLSCGARAVPEGTECVPLPPPPGAAGPSKHTLRPRANESIPRRPDRPESPLALGYPLDGPPIILFGFDTSNDPEDPESQKNSAALDLSAERGEPVKVVALRGQKGPTEVIAMGDLFGKTLVTLHSVEEAGRTHQYIAIYGRLDTYATDLKVDAKPKDGDVIGYVGDSGTSGFVHLHLDVRQIRDEIDVKPLDISRLCDQAVSIPIDLRNVLPTKSGD